MNTLFRWLLSHKKAPVRKCSVRSGVVERRGGQADKHTMRQRSVLRENCASWLVGHRWLALIVCEMVVLVLASGVVWAREDPKQEAKARYSTGQSHYNLNEFQEALREFKEAYRLFPDPAFLFNAAQCERQLGHQEEAIQFYRSYLRNAPKAANRQEVEHRIEELQTAMEAAKKAAPPAAAVEPSTATPTPAANPPVVPAPDSTPAPALPAAAVPEPTPTAPPAAPTTPPAATAVPVGSQAQPASAAAGVATPPASESSETRADLVSSPARSAEAEEPAFYQRWWFWTGVAVVAAGIGVGVYALTAGGSSQAPGSQLGTKNVF
jgi:tetratricopeptide (TPR) repeat protein